KGLEVDALDDLSVANIEARDDAFRKHGSLAHEPKEVLQNTESHLARFLWMELHAEDLIALDNRRKRLAVLGRSHRIRRERRGVAVSEVHLRPLRHAVDQNAVTPTGEAGPPDVGHLQAGSVGVARQPVDGAREQAEPAQVGRLFTSFIEPLHPQTNPQERTTYVDRRPNRGDPVLVQNPRCLEMPNTGDDDALRLLEIGRYLRREHRS